MRTSSPSTDHSPPKSCRDPDSLNLTSSSTSTSINHHNNNHGETNRWRGPNRQAHRRSRPSQSQSARRSRPRKQGSEVHGLLQGKFRQTLRSNMRSATSPLQLCLTSSRNSTPEQQTSSPEPPPPAESLSAPIAHSTSTCARPRLHGCS